MIREAYLRPKYQKSQKTIFTLKNYKSIKELKIKIQNLTILVGENASGKTNILECIYNNQGGFIDETSLQELFAEQFDFIHLKALAEYKLDFEYNFIAKGVNNLSYELIFEENNKTFSVKGLDKSVKIPVLSKYYKKDKNKSTKDKFISSFKEYFKTKEGSIKYFTILLKLFDYRISEIETIINDELFKILHIGLNLFNNNQNSIFQLMSALPIINNNINDVLENTLNLNKSGESISIILTLETDINKDNNAIEIDRFRILIKDDSEETVFPPSYKSSGINSILMIVIINEFLKHYTNSSVKNFGDLDYLLAIDEPELHIHPSIQISLSNYLLKTTQEYKSINYILSTHSPYIINHNALASTYIVRYDKLKGTQCENVLSNIFDNQNLLSCSALTPIETTLGVKLNEFCHPIILVEGEEELMLFRKFKNIFNMTNSIICIGGKNNVSPYLIILHKTIEHNQKFLLFLDADIQQNKDIKNVSHLEKVLDKLQNNIFFIGKTLYNYNDYKGSNPKLKKKGRFGEALEDLVLEIIGIDKTKELLKSEIEKFTDKYKPDWITDDTSYSYFEIKEILLNQIEINDPVIIKNIFKSFKKSIFHQAMTEENFTKIERIFQPIIEGTLLSV